jgi:hypothetical protein
LKKSSSDAVLVIAELGMGTRNLFLILSQVRAFPWGERVRIVRRTFRTVLKGIKWALFVYVFDDTRGSDWKKGHAAQWTRVF